MLPTRDVSSHTIPSANPRKTRPILLVAEEVVWGNLRFKGLGEGKCKISGWGVYIMRTGKPRETYRFCSKLFK